MPLVRVIDPFAAIVRLACLTAAPQGVQVAERAAVHPRARRGQRLRSHIRAGKPQHLMAGADQLVDHRRADPTGSAGHKHTHEQGLQVSLQTDIGSDIILVK